MPHLEIDKVEITNVGFQPNDDIPVEGGDIIVWMYLSVYIDNVTVEQVNDLQSIGYTTILDIDYVKRGVTKFRIEYKTAYGFTFWDGEVGKAPLEDGFSGFVDE